MKEQVLFKYIIQNGTNLNRSKKIVGKCHIKHFIQFCLVRKKHLCKLMEAHLIHLPTENNHTSNQTFLGSNNNNKNAIRVRFKKPQTCGRSAIRVEILRLPQTQFQAGLDAFCLGIKTMMFKLQLRDDKNP